MRNSFRRGIERLLEVQRELGRPLLNSQRPKLDKIVHAIVVEAELRDDPRRKYFTLLATCALMGRESMYCNFKSRRKHGHEKENQGKSKSSKTC